MTVIRANSQVLWHVSVKGTADRYQLVMDDDFNSLQKERWSNSYPWGRHITGKTAELETQEYYSDGANIRINDGILRLEARKEKICGICEPWQDSSAILSNGLKNYRCFEYSSGMLFANQTTGQGYYEIRFRQSPSSNGLWPAFWLFKDGNEIDIFENKGERKNETHWDLHCKDGCSGKKGGWKKVNADFQKNFNNVSLAWNAVGMRWYVNDINYQSSRQQFNAPLHMIVNLAVSRTNDQSGFWVGPDQSTRFPSLLEVDYIKYYRNIYEARKLKKVSREKADLRSFTSSSDKKKISSKKLQPLSYKIEFDQEDRKLALTRITGDPVELNIYDRSGKLIQSLRSDKGITKSSRLPDEVLIITARQGKWLFTDRIEK